MEPSYFEGKVKIGSRDLKWASTFPTTMGFECARCGFCCVGKIGLTRPDLISFSKNDLTHLIDPVNMPSAGTPFDRLIRRKPDGACVNLNDRSLCSIYPMRPMVCRCYPFMLSPGYEGDTIMDIMLHCPYVDIAGSKSKPPKQKDLDLVASEYAKNTPDLMPNTTDYMTTLVEHVRATVPAAFFPSGRKFQFMRKAIELMAFENHGDIVETSKNWAGAISESVHNALTRRDISDSSQMPSDAEMLSPISFGPGQNGFDKSRVKNTLADLSSLFIFPDRGAVNAARGKAGLFGLKLRTTKSGSLSEIKISFASLSKMGYSPESVRMLKDYLNILIRRSSFQYCVARSADFLTDYMRMGAVDFQLEAAIIANGVMPQIDPLARLVCAIHGGDSITREDMRYAIANVDGGLIGSLINDSLANQIVKFTSRDFGARSRKRRRIGF